MEQVKIYTAICNVMKGIKAIGKDKTNQMQKFNYRGVDDVMNELHSLLAENGVFIVPQVLESCKQQQGTTKNGNAIFETRMKIKYTFYADDGSNIEAVVVGEAIDSGDKGANKALSIAFKYVCLQIFCIPTEEDKDPDAQSYSVTKKQQPAKKEAAPRREAPKPADPKPQPQLKGGDTTPEQKAYIQSLLQATTEDGAPVFTQGQKVEYLRSRAELTAQELIYKIEDYLGLKHNGVQTLYEAPAAPAPTQTSTAAPAAPQKPAQAPQSQELSFDTAAPMAADGKPEIF